MVLLWENYKTKKQLTQAAGVSPLHVTACHPPVRYFGGNLCARSPARRMNVWPAAVATDDGDGREIVSPKFGRENFL
jgi:hypothetical protein